MLGSKLRWSLTICFFVALYPGVYSCPKISPISFFFIYNYSLFWYSFCNQPDLFAHLENINKLWNNNLISERNQNTSRSEWPHVLLLDLAHKQRNRVIKGWLHSLISESKGRFLVNNMLLAWSLVMAQIQYFLIKKVKIGRPKHLLTPHPPTSDNISFLLYAVSPPPSKWKSYVHHH